MVNNTKEDFIFISNSSWNEGLIGIIASSIKEQFNKPTFVISTHGNAAKGSARSVSGLDIGQIVMEAKELKIISKGGGHKMAAGFSLDKDSLVL
ncbi:MAG: DHHA1 domain-containing protein, partial [Candidatus Fonsibacter sp.]